MTKRELMEILNKVEDNAEITIATYSTDRDGWSVGYALCIDEAWVSKDGNVRLNEGSCYVAKW